MLCCPQFQGVVSGGVETVSAGVNAVSIIAVHVHSHLNHTMCILYIHDSCISVHAGSECARN